MQKKPVGEMERSKLQEQQKAAGLGREQEFVVVVLVFAASLIALVWIYFTFIAPAPTAMQELNVTPPVIFTITETGIAENVSACLAGYGLNERTVVFIYEDGCPYSERNVPFVRELESAGYVFYWAKPSDPSTILPITTCLAGIASLSGTPEFVCPAKRRAKLGAFGSKAELLTFVEECIK